MRAYFALALAIALAVFPAKAAAVPPTVYATNSVAIGSVSQYTAGPTGALAPLSPPTVAAGDRPAQIAVSPDGKSAYVTNRLSGTSASTTSPPRREPLAKDAPHGRGGHDAERDHREPGWAERVRD